MMPIPSLAAPQTWLNALKSVANWVWPAKFLVGSVLSIIAGGGVLSFLLENATHLYALTYGFRPPVEGLPYLRTLIATGSAILLLLAALIAAVLLGLLGGLARFGAKRSDRGAGDLTKVRLWVAILVSIVGWLLLSGLLLYLERHRAPIDPYCGWPLLFCEPRPTLTGSYFAYSFAITFPLVFMLFRPAFAWVATSGAIAAYYVWVSSNILPPSEYARLLRSTGFGGGLSVAVETAQSETGCSTSGVNGYLMLRTTENFIIYEQQSSRIIELPVRCVSRVSHGSGGMSAQEFKLPHATPLIERQKSGA